jgi:hypothetical protein
LGRQEGEKLSDFQRRGKLLPYLINRERQERQLAKAIQAHPDRSRPLLCFIHGNDNECQDKFIDRLPETILSREEPRNGIKIYPFSCSGMVRHANELHDHILDSLGEILLNKLGAQPEEIAQAIVREQRVVLLYMSLSTKYWKAVGGMEFIQNFLQFWVNWPHLPTQNHLVIICLNFHYEEIEKRFFWHDWFNKPTLNQEIRQVFNEQLESILQQYQLNGVVLPELNSLEQEDVKNWARKYLRECYDEIILQIRELFSSSEHQIPMEQLVKHLKQIQQEC